MKHYTKTDLEMYKNGKMSILGRLTCSSHLADCLKCKKLMVELQHDDELVADLQKSIAVYPAPDLLGAADEKGDNQPE